jgi:DNA-binding NarL/FixJ family response regulator
MVRVELTTYKGDWMSAQVTLVLIVGKPGPLRNSLHALMTTMPLTEVVAEASDSSALLRMGDSIQPDILLIDASLSEDIWPALEQIRKEWSRTRTIVLVEDSVQLRRATDAGADVALPKGFRAAKLAAIVEELLSR